MTKKTKNGKGKSATPAGAGFDPTAMFQHFMSNFLELPTDGKNPVSGVLEMNRQWMNFLSERVRKDSELLQKLSKCTSPAEIGVAQMEFCHDAARHYQREFAQMTDLGQRAIGQFANTAPQDKDTQA
jgi:hypothetical protein